MPPTGWRSIAGSGSRVSIGWRITSPHCKQRKKKMGVFTDARREDAGATLPELTVSRLIEAPPALVFKLWTEQDHAARWWGPQGFTDVSCRLDGRPGGTFRIAMRAPDGSVHTKQGVFHEVVPPELLVFTYTWEDPDGRLGH